ncbi:MAG: LysM peptidoglycan-binding domain-containing protein [Halobacteriovoraceae bacterium]|nr:LysM peptidoglycan-binding domain-containing protein [Halobacteriovoraceae bacterium]
MKLKKLLPLLLIFVFVTACSNNETKKAGGDNTASEEADFVVDSEGEQDLEFEESEDGEEDMAMNEEKSDEGEADKGGEEMAQAKDQSEAMQDEGYSEAPVAIDGGSVSSYTVKRGDTLMLIAFKNTCDYDKWKEIKQMNGLSGSSISPGQTLKIPTATCNFNPEGLPYLIMRGDTLGSISQDKYGTKNKWRSIFNNNKPMIKNPNLIFAGFTLYYLQDTRDIASE